MSKKKIEHRNFKNREINVDEESRTIAGYAAVFERESEDLGRFTEVIDPKAFSATDMSDVRALINHDSNKLLARSSSGTLSLEVDDQGLRYEFQVPDTTYGRDLVVMMQRGDITQSSFGFTVSEDKWEEREGGVPLRRITKIDRLYDVSPVTFPAYPDTSVAVRSLESWKEEISAEEKEEHDNEVAKEQTELINVLTARTGELDN